MSKYIDADELNEAVSQCQAEPFTKNTVYALTALMGDKRKHGEWICVSTANTWYEQWACNQCSGIMNVKTNFCPNCGANMRGNSKCADT